MLSTFYVCLHHTQFMPHSFFLEFCRDFQFVTALRMPEENQKLHISSSVLRHYVSNFLLEIRKYTLGFGAPPVVRFINAFQS